MNERPNRHATVAKKAALVFVSALLFVLVLVSSASVIVFAQVGLYTESYGSSRQAVAETILMQNGTAGDVYSMFLQDPSNLQTAYANGNFWYQISDENGQILTGNYDGAPCFYQSHHVFPDGNRVDLFVKQNMTADDLLATVLGLFDFAWAARYWMIGLGAVSLLLLIGSVVILCCLSGRRAGQEEAQLNRLDRIPYDVLAVVVVGCMVLFSGLFYWPMYLNGAALLESYTLIAIGCMLLAFVADYLLLLMLTSTTAARIKCGTLFRNTVIYKVFRGLFRAFRAVWRNLKFVWKTVVCLAVLWMAEWIYLMAFVYQSFAQPFLLWFISRLVLSALVLYVSIAFSRLQRGARKMGDGDFNYQIRPSYMPGDFKDFAHTLNHIADGMQLAVEQQTRSERMKAELITNVSHDIKTPLTSIINYVDLLKKEPAGSERAAEYLQVLDRQSARMKKLIEDLVEVSKASTGNLTVTLEKLDFCVFLSQIVGEYRERLEQCGLELVLNLPETPVWISADGRYLWRVVDNLLSNICKYAQPQTRVYLDLEQHHGKASVLFRNISKTPLNISGEELLERFVRGDSARSTEGSGLGLPIAKSLTELQKGELVLVVDGDLFKVVLIFDALDCPEGME